jgi:opacity protein-like surface antigen
MKQFDDTQRNSSAYGGNLTVKENLTPSFWFRQIVDYELNDADSAYFSYSGITGGLGMGYGFATKTQLALGYNYQVREFDEPSGLEMRTSTAYLGIDQPLGGNWTVSMEYDYQQSKDNVTGMTMTNNIYSLAIRYGY